jgi:hypothetical protein
MGQIYLYLLVISDIILVQSFVFKEKNIVYGYNIKMELVLLLKFKWGKLQFTANN